MQQMFSQRMRVVDIRCFIMPPLKHHDFTCSFGKTLADYCEHYLRFVLIAHWCIDMDIYLYFHDFGSHPLAAVVTFCFAIATSKVLPDQITVTAKYKTQHNNRLGASSDQERPSRWKNHPAEERVVCIAVVLNASTSFVYPRLCALCSYSCVYQLVLLLIFTNYKKKAFSLEV
jgi:hypothetical protein